MLRSWEGKLARKGRQLQMRYAQDLSLSGYSNGIAIIVATSAVVMMASFWLAQQVVHGKHKGVSTNPQQQ